MVLYLRIDCHNGGPIIYNDRLKAFALNMFRKNTNINEIIREINNERINLLLSNRYPEYDFAWDKSGVNIAIRTLGIFGTPAFSQKSIFDDIEGVERIYNNSERYVKVFDVNTLNSCVFGENNGYIGMIESIEDFENDYYNLEILCANNNVAIIQPVYNYSNFFGCGCFENNDFGITQEGKDALKILETYKIIIDHSHLSEQTAIDILESGYPYNIATHTFSSKISNNNRGKSDKFFALLKECNGLAAITVNPNLILGSHKTVEQAFIKNVEHIINIVGEDNIGVGTDWDGPMPNFMCHALDNAASSLCNTDYHLNACSNLYNGMCWWDNLADAISLNYGNTIANKIVGENAYNYFYTHYTS